MQQFIFIIFFLAALFTAYKGLSDNNLFFLALAMGLNLGLWGALQVDGISFLSQLTTNGTLVYTAQTGANNPFISALSYFHFAIGFLSIFGILGALNNMGWKLPALR